MMHKEKWNDKLTETDFKNANHTSEFGADYIPCMK
jgi:hypothetical protein